MLDKKYISRTDLKVAGFEGLFFYVTEDGRIGLKCKKVEKLNKDSYMVFWDVTCDRIGTSTKNIEHLCRLVLTAYNDFLSLKSVDRKRFIEDRGVKI